jgi:hypothetical protein
MGIFIVEGVFPITWIVYTVWVSISRWRIMRLLGSLHDPQLCLTRKERRAHARELLARDREQYTESVYRHLVDGPTPLKGDVSEK